MSVLRCVRAFSRRSVLQSVGWRHRAATSTASLSFSSKPSDNNNGYPTPPPEFLTEELDFAEFMQVPVTSADVHDEQTEQPTTDYLLEGLNPSQIQAVTLPTESIARVVAGPGSGKTKVLTTRIAYLLHQTPRKNILAVTFTRKAAGEMQKRVEALLTTDASGPVGLERVTLGTFHSICAKILRYNGDLLLGLPSVQFDILGRPGLIVNMDGSFAILDQSDQLRVVRECLKEENIDLTNESSGVSVRPLNILNVFSQFKEAISQGNDPFQKQTKKGMPESPTMRIAKKIYRIYREKLLLSNSLDFDDLIYMARELLIEHDELRERLCRRWPHVLVDEFQDTSRSQMDLVKLLTSSSLFVVGDSDQSIYSWRGAHVGSLHDFSGELEGYAGAEGVHTVFLKENYRSTSNIVKAAEKVISSTGFSSSQQADELRKAMKPKRGKGASPRVIACVDGLAEASFVVNTILEMLEKETIQASSSVAVIYRTNAQSRHLEEACVEKNLHYVIRGGAGGFYKRAEIKDCLCFLRWLYNGNDESAMLRAMKTPSKGLGDKSIADFRDYCDEVDRFYQMNFPNDKRPTKLDIVVSLAGNGAKPSFVLTEGAPEPSGFIAKRALNAFEAFSHQMASIRMKGFDAPLDELLSFVVDKMKLIPHFDAISKSKAEFEDRQQNVQELCRATKRYQTESSSALENIRSDGDESFEMESPLSRFLDDVSLVTDIEEEPSDDDRLVVNLMTIHASKGMEFDAVFVVGIEEGTLPSGLAIQEGENSVQLEEEKRLCYVAMTRAKSNLILTWRKEVTYFPSGKGASTREMKRSRFLDALVSKVSHSSQGKAPKAVLKDDALPRRQERSNGSHLSPSRMDRAGSQRSYFSSDSSRSRPIPTTRMHGQKVTSSQKSDAPSRRVSTTNAVTQNAATDSTVIFPVGSSVVHRNFGKGVVLPPPSSTSASEAQVRVQFEGGRTKDFPLLGVDLSPDLGF